MGKDEDVVVIFGSFCTAIILYRERWKIELVFRLQSITDGCLQVARNTMIVSGLFEKMKQ